LCRAAFGRAALFRFAGSRAGMAFCRADAFLEGSFSLAAAQALSSREPWCVTPRTGLFVAGAKKAALFCFRRAAR